MSDTVVGAHRSVEDAFVDRYLTHDGESVEEAQQRLREQNENKQKVQEEQRIARREEREKRHHRG